MRRSYRFFSASSGEGNRKMKIAFILPSLENRGPIIFTQYLIGGLIKDPAVDVEIFYIRNRVEVSFPVRTHHLTFGNYLRLFEFDLIHSTMFLPDMITAMLPVPRLRKIVSLHNFIKEDMGFLYSPRKAALIIRLWYWALGFFGGTIYSSDFMARHYESNKKSSNYKVIHYGIRQPTQTNITPDDLELFDHLRSQSLTLIGAVCLVIKRKGLDQLVRALVELPDCAVVVIGDGPEAEALRALSKDLGVSDRFFILGFRQDSAKYNFLFDAFAMVSRSEGFCLAMLEAFGCGTPVICSRLPIYADIISENEVAYFDVDSNGSLVAAINLVKSRLNYYQACSDKIFQNQFRISEMSNKHVDYYKELLSLNC